MRHLFSRALVRVLATCLLGLTSIAAHSYTIDTNSASPSNVTGLWWNSSESGWGITLTQQSNIVFGAMFTYDGAGNPHWYVVTNCPISGDGCAGDLYRVRGGSAPTSTWDGRNLALQKVGTIAMSFTDVNTGRLVYSIDGASGFKSITRQVFASSPPPPPATNSDLANSQKLLGGTWTYTYTIISTFSDSYSFLTVDATPSSSGEYYARGRDQYGNTVIGGYYPPGKFWSVLDTGIIIDQYYTFTFTDNNRVSGCYYQINPPGSTSLSRCYPMTGSRSPPKEFMQKSDPETLRREVAADPTPVHVDPAVVESYLHFKRLVQ